MNEKQGSLSTSQNADQASQSSEQQLAAIIASAMDGIITIDAQERITVFNAAAEQMFSCKASDVLGQSLDRLIPPRYHQAHSGHIRAFAGEARGASRPMGKHVAVSGLRANGEEFPIEASISQIEIEGQRLFTVILRDITERKQAEAAVAESEGKFRLLSENITDVFWISSPDLQKIYYVSPGYQRIWGSPAEEIYADPHQWVEAIVPEDRDRVIGVFKELMENAPTVSTEYRIKRPDGSFRWIHDRGFQVRDSTGRLVRLTGIAADITERKRSEEALRDVSSKESTRNQKGVLWDLTVIFILTAIVFTIGHVYDVFDPIFLYFAVQNHQLNSDLEEVFATIIFFGFAMMVFSYRRWRENRAEVTSQTQISKALSILHNEMETQVRERTAQLAQTNETLRHEVAERQRAEAVIKQFPAIIESSDDAIISKTLNGIVTSWNPAAERMFGYTASEMIGKPITLLFPPNRLEEESAILARISRGEHVRHFETVRKRKDGRLLDVSATISPIKDAGGKITGISKIVRDITERKREEKMRHLTEARYRTLFEYAPDGILIPNSEGTYIDANARMCQMLGYTREELIGRHASDIVAQTEIPQIDLALNEITSGSDHHREWLFRRKDGSTFSAEVIATMMPDGYLLAMVRDITERKKAEEQIKEQADFLDKATDAILVRNLQGNILFWNNGAERMYGWNRREVLGRNIGNLLYDDSKKFDEVNALTISQGAWHGELQHQTKDRGAITIEARWTLIKDNEGRPKSILAINSDITEKKKIEVQFMRAQRMESIGTLAGGIAHDLNNILSPIMMSIDILKAISDKPQAAQILETIEISAKRGADIVRQVLSFARGLEGQRIEVQPKHLLKDLENIIRDTFPKDIKLKFSIPSDSWTILGDPTQVHQILLNLCVNARDAMPRGGTLTVSAANAVLDEQYTAMNLQAKPGRYVLISVTDSGTGIPRDILDKIFDPFFTTKELNKGTGLGLSTVMAIVKSHDGIINVYSEPGKGTTFKVYLPATETSLEARQHQTEQASLPRGKGETILLVDDEASILTITSQTLQAFGYRVITAVNGAEAVAAYAQNRDIALAITDMMMPIMDGQATIHALLNINPNLKIIAASGLSANGDAAKASDVGIKNFLTKPFTASTLLKMLRSILDAPD